MMRFPEAKTDAIAATESLKCSRLGTLFSLNGVGTAITKTSAGSIVFVADKVPLETVSLTKFYNSGSIICILPLFIISTVFLFLS